MRHCSLSSNELTPIFELVNQTANTPQRLDIQGLRAVALMLVIVYHANLPIHGGYVGVDVFFVVSGYVLTVMIAREYELTRKFSLGRFIGNRIHRLMPATVVTVSITTLGFLPLLSPFGELPSLIDASQSNALFVGNIHFSRQDPYFQVSENPLLHLWSLGVEAQFYLSMALVVFASLKLGKYLNIHYKKLLSLLILLISVVSLVAAESLLWLTGASYRSVFQITPERFSFYWMPTRFWEFGLGVLAALLPALKGKNFRRFAQAIGWGGFGLVILSALSLDKFSRFPGVSALPAVVGTAMILVAGDSTSPVSKILSNSVLVWIGNNSFGWYLWHWPFVVAAKILISNHGTVLLLASVAALIPSILTKRFIESPARSFARKSLFASVSLVASCVVLAIAIIPPARLAVNLISDFRVSVPEAWGENRASILAGCDYLSPRKQIPTSCIWGAPKSTPDVFLIGDSHAASASDGVIAATSELGLTLAIANFGGCPFLVPSVSKSCDLVVKDSRLSILRSTARTVIIANSGLYYLSEGNSIPNSKGRTSATTTNQILNYTQALFNSVTELKRYGLKVVVLMPVPEMDFSNRVSLIQPHPALPEPTDLQNQELRRALLEQMRLRLSKIPGVIILETDSVFCPSDRCSAVSYGQWLYMDQTHLNPIGSQLLSSEIVRILKSQT